MLTLKIGTQSVASLLKTSPMRELSGKIHSMRLTTLTTCGLSVTLVTLAIVLFEGSVVEVDDSMRNGGSIPKKG